MSIKQTLKRAMSNAVRTAIEIAQKDTRAARNVEAALAAGLRDADHRDAPIGDMVAYIDVLRSCIEPLAQNVITIRKSNDASDAVGRRFAQLLQMLETQIPPIPFTVAIDIAKHADLCRSLRMPIDWERWSGDAGLLFEMASSFGRKGRILSAIIRMCRPERCLELGTAFGMSAIFMMETFKQMGLAGRLVTIECLEPQFSIAARGLTDRYGENVSCCFGLSGSVLPQLAEAGDPINFMFHDAGHTGDIYVADFTTIVDTLASGAVVLFDDIRWEDARFHSGPIETHRGWLKVTSHPRVRHAVEIEGTMGLVLLR